MTVNSRISTNYTKEIKSFFSNFFNGFLEGDNLLELNKMAQDGGPKHLGAVGRNLQLMAINSRASADMPRDEVRVEDPELAAQRRAWDEEQYYERQQADREEAMLRTGFKAMPKAERVAALPDSDEAVDDFLKNVW